jgi:hypothetical protein
MGSSDQKCCFSSRAYFVSLTLILPSLLSLIESSLQCLLIMPTFIVALAINDKHSLSVKYLPTISPFGIDGNTSIHMHSDSPPKLFSPPLTSMLKKKHAPPEMLQNILPPTMSILEIYQIFNKYSPDQVNRLDTRNYNPQLLTKISKRGCC